MRYVCFLISLSLLACGRPSAKVDPILKPYFLSFETNVGATTEYIDAEFISIEPPNVGLCQTYDSGDNKKITVDPAYWANASESQRQQLIYHELGHCVLGLAHVTTFKVDQCPTSIMYPYTFGDSYCYSNERNYYFQELESHKN